MSTHLASSTLFQSLKRTRDSGNRDAHQSSKERRVRFSDASSTRFFETLPLQMDLTVSCEVASDEISHQLSEVSCSPSHAIACPLLHEPDDLKGELDIRTQTKMQDGPSAATLATQRIIRFIIKQRKINRSIIADFLRDATAACSFPPCADTSSSTIQHDSSVISVERPTEIDPALCHAVSRRLRALGDRIEERGKASMLPCASNLGPTFLRPLRLLESAVALCIALPMDQPRPSHMACG
jgi:hypothetical protein